MPRTLEEAKAIVDVATEFKVSTWDNPEAVTDKDVMERADKLVDACLQASANQTTNEPVLEILRVAGVAPISDVTREAYAQRFGVAPPAAAQTNGHASEPEGLSSAASAFVAATDAQLPRVEQPTTSPPSTSSEAQGALSNEQASSAPVGSPESANEATPAAGEDSIEDIYPGYDDEKVSDIKAAILASAASGDLSPEEWERIKTYEAANEERKTILSLEPEFKAPEPEPQPEPAWTSSGRAGDFTQSPNSDASLDQIYVGSVQTRAQQEGLPIPAHVALDQAPIVPVNITDISDSDLSALGAVFHSLFARAQWLISQEEGRAASAEHLEREAEHDAYVRAYALHKEQIPAEKRTQPTALEAARKQAEKDAEVADSVRTWRSRRVRHGVEVRELKALANGYDKAVWRIDKELDRRARAATTARAAS